MNARHCRSRGSCGWVAGLAGLLALVAGARAEDLLLPTFRTFAGAFLVGRDHNFFVESEVDLPLVHDDVWTLAYHHKESTPFLALDQGVQADLLYSRDELEFEWQPFDWLRVLALGGHRHAYHEDRSGQLAAYVYGGGLGSPRRGPSDHLQWLVMAGGYATRAGAVGDWWANADANWRLFDFIKDRYLNSKYRASVALGGTLDGVYADGNFLGLYRIGPQIQFRTANGNLAKFDLGWYYNDHNPFYGLDENGLLLGLEICSSHEDSYVLHARQRRQPGWFPLVWGDYDVGGGENRVLTRFTMNTEVVDFLVADHLVTGFVWYENRQEYRPGDFDNVAYSVALGLQSAVGLESPLSQGDPLVAGIDFEHRSDHALNPDPDRVAARGEPTSIGPLLVNGSINVLPRLRLQTIGWDLPYRDPAMYDRHTAWLNAVNWRLTAGCAVGSSRDRGRFAGQAGINWDLATIEGYVPYLFGQASIGNETPDWLVEAGVRRPAGKVFVRFESYGTNPDLARGNTVSAGVGVNL